MMQKPVPAPPTCPTAERAERIAWAAHILRYLSGEHCHPRSGTLPELERRPEADVGQEADTDAEDSAGADTDVETERATVLSGTETAMRRMFLDACAELLSPEKGWGCVTATVLREAPDSITITVARNDTFVRTGVGDERPRCRDLLARLRAYLQGGDRDTETAGSLTVLEKALVAYHGARTRDCLGLVRSYVSAQERVGTSSGPALPDSVVRHWQRLRETALRDQADEDDAEQAVLDAYALVCRTDIRQPLGKAYGEPLARKLWRCLHFLARPLTNCRLLSCLVTHLPPSPTLLFELIVDQATKTARHRRRVRLQRALRSFLPAQQFQTLDAGALEALEHRFGDQFQKDVAKAPYAQHAEVQALQHLWSTSTASAVPALTYVGCSKKTCLLCEEFLGHLDPPMATRGRHGICYPAWGAPHSRAQSVSWALQAVETSLVARILEQLAGQPGRTVLGNVAQSSLILSATRMAEDSARTRDLIDQVDREGSVLRQKQEIV